MSKALVIKNADFSENKLGTVTFNDIHCTGASFSSASVTLSQLGTATIDYTITPANCTDDVIFTTSDSTVLSVNGTTFTVVGIGNCTLTLSCGRYTANCEVVVDIYETPIINAGVPARYTVDGVKIIELQNAGTQRFVCAQPYENSGFVQKIINGSTQIQELGDTAPIRIPQNAKFIHVEARNLYDNENQSCVFFMDTENDMTYNGRHYNIINNEANPAQTKTQGVVSINAVVPVPDGETAYIIMLRLNSTYESDFALITTEAAAQTFAEQTVGLSIHYLTEDPTAE